MTRDEVFSYTASIDELVSHANRFAPEGTRGVTEFRAELGGLLTVLIASCYENIVKQTLIDYSTRHHLEFGRFTEGAFSKLNSRIQLRDLRQYCSYGSPSILSHFKDKMARRKSFYRRIARVEIDKAYEQLLLWRHDYAHAGKKNTTIEEAVRTHKEGFPVLLSFTEAFEKFSP